MRLRSVLASILFAGCTIQASNPPPRYGYQQPPPTQQPPQQVQVQPPPIQPPVQQPPQPEPVYYDEPGNYDINVGFNGDIVWSIDVFYDQLDPYGTWYNDQTYGW